MLARFISLAHARHRYQFLCESRIILGKTLAMFKNRIAIIVDLTNKWSGGRSSIELHDKISLIEKRINASFLQCSNAGFHCEHFRFPFAERFVSKKKTLCTSCEGVLLFCSREIFEFFHGTLSRSNIWRRRQKCARTRATDNKRSFVTGKTNSVWSAETSPEMSQGVLRLCTLGGEHFLKCPRPIHPSRLFSGSARLRNKDGKPIEGVAYKNLSIGVPKEKWTNERRLDRYLCYWRLKNWPQAIVSELRYRLP